MRVLRVRLIKEAFVNLHLLIVGSSESCFVFAGLERIRELHLLDLGAAVFSRYHRAHHSSLPCCLSARDHILLNGG